MENYRVNEAELHYEDVILLISLLSDYSDTLKSCTDGYSEDFYKILVAQCDRLTKLIKSLLVD